jgi:hypothetical protein
MTDDVLHRDVAELVEFVEQHLEQGFADPAKLAAWRVMPVYLQRQDIAELVAELLHQRFGRLGVALSVEAADCVTEHRDSPTGWHVAAEAEAAARGAESGREAAARKIAFITRLAAVRAAEADRIFELVDSPAFDDEVH